MAHTNRYFIVIADDTNLLEIEQVIVGEPTTQRYSIDGSQIVVKLHQNDHSNYSFLEQYEEYDNEQILIMMATHDWTTPIDIESDDLGIAISMNTTKSINTIQEE
jgi:hypothetical protein